MQAVCGTDHRAVMAYGWEGNRRFGVRQAIHHRLKWFIHGPKAYKEHQSTLFYGTLPIPAAADIWLGVTSGCLCNFACVRAIKQKRLELSTPQLGRRTLHGSSSACIDPAVKRLKVIGHQMRCAGRRGYICTSTRLLGFMHAC